jgi:presequence protease
MPDTQPCPPPTCKAGDELHGFRITRVTPIPEIRVTAYEAVHHATGAQVLHLHSDDRENWYATTFRTPPPDSTGVAHILEHSVLAGSRKYPVRDAFNELGKASLRTFLNAFTAPDFTCYPVASQVRADFYNLAAVYTDLVLRPLLRENTFRQEGHHLEVSEDGTLTVSGIVYNEMKGAYSSAERVAESTTQQAIFPDTPYGVESGGHPDQIPDLTYEGFREFHRRFYSPGNCRVFFCGNIATADHLAFLAGQFQGFSRLEVDSAVPEQQRWSAPREVHDHYPAGPDEPLDRKTTVNIAWLTASMADSAERLILEVLAEALIGNAAGPLRQALVDSGLGEDLSPSTGLQGWFRQLPFVVGLRGTDAEKAAEIEQLALSTLSRIAQDGLPRDLIEAAFHQVEFKGREISPQRALEHLFRTMVCWLHDLDPVEPLRFASLVTALRQRWEREPHLFRDATRRWLVDNQHRLRAVIAPSRTLAAEGEARLRERLAGLQAGMSEEQIARIRRDADALREEQRAPETPEALATLPQLRLDQIPREAETIPGTGRSEGEVPVHEHDIFTNGIAYLDILFDISDLPEEMQALLPLFGAACTGMGAAGESYATFATRQSLVTGGVEFELKARDRLRGDGTLQLFALRASALARNIPKMVQVLHDILVSGDLDDTARFKDILNEERNSHRATIGPRGHVFAWRSAAASLSLAGWRDEQWHGVTQVRFLGELARKYDSDGDRIRQDLRRVRDAVFRRGRAVINLTGDAESLAALRGPVADLLGGMASGGSPAAEARPLMSRRNPGWALPGHVCYVARVHPAPTHNDPAAPALMALASHLAEGILYKKIRVEGGAYGGMAVYNPNLGQFALLSYRDPNLEKTLEVYDSAVAAFLEEDIDADTQRKVIISTVADLDRPMHPATRGRVALDRRMAGVTDEDRQRFRTSVLALDAESMRRAARAWLAGAGEIRQAVVAPKERIEAANAMLSTPFEIESVE